MDMVKMGGAAVAVVAAGGLLAWTLDDRSVEASVANPDQSVNALAMADPLMVKSGEQALTTFDDFWTMVSADKTGLDAISIKIGIQHDEGVEYVWTSGCESPDAQRFTCIISNDTVNVPLILGSSYSFQRDVIADWMYRKDGMIHGGYSIRALLPTMPAEQAEDLQVMLAPLPE